jgi:hypothetical protein
MISAKLKLIGVSPKAVGRLHVAVSDSQFKVADDYRLFSADRSDKHPHVKIEESKLDKEHGTYTISLTVNLAVDCEEKVRDHHEGIPRFVVYQSMKSLRQIFQSVDPHFLPDTEELIPADEASRQILALRTLKKEREGVSEKLHQKLKVLMGKKIPCDIKSTDGEVFIRAGEIVEGDHIFKLHCRISEERGYLDLDSITDPKLKELLIEARGIKKSLSELDEKIRLSVKR